MNATLHYLCTANAIAVAVGIIGAWGSLSKTVNWLTLSYAAAVVVWSVSSVWLFRASRWAWIGTMSALLTLCALALIQLQRTSALAAQGQLRPDDNGASFVPVILVFVPCLFLAMLLAVVRKEFGICDRD